MEASSVLVASLVIAACLAQSSYGEVLFSSLEPTLVVSATPKPGQVLKAGEDKITVTWGFNTSYPANKDTTYKEVKVKLCYAPISQKDRSWRKTKDELSKDKTCTNKIVARPYTRTTQSFESTIQKDVPQGTYFVRAYVFNADGVEVGYGQTTDAAKKDNLFMVEAITGRHASLDIAAASFSAFSVVALFGFFFLEKRKGKKASPPPNM